MIFASVRTLAGGSRICSRSLVDGRIRGTYQRQLLNTNYIHHTNGRTTWDMDTRSSPTEAWPYPLPTAAPGTPGKLRMAGTPIQRISEPGYQHWRRAPQTWHIALSFPSPSQSPQLPTRTANQQVPLHGLRQTACQSQSHPLGLNCSREGFSGVRRPTHRRSPP